MTQVAKSNSKIHSDLIKEKFNAREFIAFVLEKMSDSIGDMVITVLVLAFMLVYTVQLLPVQVSGPFNGMLITGMVVQLLIRIVHRFDDSYTTNELAERVIEMEHNLTSEIGDVQKSIDDLTILEK